MSLLVSLLIGVLIIAVVLWLARIILSNLPLSPTVANIILAIVALILLLWLLQYIGLVNVL